MMIDPKKILALFDEPTKNQGLILHYAYQAMPELAHRVIELEEQVDPYWMNKAQELDTENANLRAVAEAAKRLYEICFDMPIDFPSAGPFVWGMGDLKEALTAAGYGGGECNIDIKDEFIKELKEEIRLRQAELEGSRCLIKQIGSTLRKAWEEHKEGEPYPGFNDEDIGWVFDSLAELEQLRHYVNCLHHRKCILPDYCDPDCQNCYALITFKEV